MLVKVCVEDSLGFITPLGKRKPPPKKLALDLNDIMLYNITEVSFTSAFFNMANGEQFITTSTGQYLIIWNFESIKKGKAAEYKIKKLGDEVVRS